jgi:hypothetical protein
MRSSWLDPYLWVHLAGLAALPIFLELCLLGLAVGYPILPPALELLLIAGVGIAPILWMQWQRPFYIFSLLAVALKPNQLTEPQRKKLRFFKTQETRIVSLLAPVALCWVLWQLYRLAPLAADITPIPSGLRLLGLLVAAIAFLGCNLFLQVPLSVLRVLLVSDQALAAADPYPVNQIAQDFTLLGLKVDRLLPALVSPQVGASVTTGSSPASSTIPIASDSPLSQPESDTAWDETDTDFEAAEPPTPETDASAAGTSEPEAISLDVAPNQPEATQPESPSEPSAPAEDIDEKL